jgi:hypothetical protein
VTQHIGGVKTAGLCVVRKSALPVYLTKMNFKSGHIIMALDPELLRELTAATILIALDQLSAGRRQRFNFGFIDTRCLTGFMPVSLFF